MDDSTPRVAEPPPPRGFLADHPLRVDPVTARLDRRLVPLKALLGAAFLDGRPVRRLVRILVACPALPVSREFWRVVGGRLRSRPVRSGPPSGGSSARARR